MVELVIEGIAASSLAAGSKRANEPADLGGELVRDWIGSVQVLGFHPG
jgi:hypothetical protein